MESYLPTEVGVVRMMSPVRGLFFSMNLSPFSSQCKRSYFATVPDENADPELLKLGTDRSLFDDAGFLPFAQKYRDDQDAFFEDYKKVRSPSLFTYLDVCSQRHARAVLARP